jgi:hypothetical protein
VPDDVQIGIARDLCQDEQPALANSTSRQRKAHYQDSNSRIAHGISKDNTAKMSLVSGEKSNFQFILRLLNTNVRESSHVHTSDGRWWIWL